MTQQRTNGIVLAALLALAALVAFGLGWIWWSGESADALLGRPALAQSDELRSAIGDPSAAGTGAIGTGDERHAAALAVAPGSPAPLAGERAVAPPGGVLVRVVDAATGAPIAGAEVVASRPRGRSTPREVQALRRNSDLFAWLDEFGQRGVTDAEGQVGLYCGVAALQIACRKDDLYGERSMRLDDPGSGLVVVRMVRDEQVVVRVVDAAARPLANVPLGIVSERRRPDAVQHDRNSSAVGETDEDGRFVVRHLQILRREHCADALFLTVASPAFPPPLRALHGEPEVELVLRDVGTIVVHLSDAEGRPLHDQEPCEVALVPRFAEEQAALVPDWADCVRQCFAENGTVTFRGVALGADWLVQASWRGLEQREEVVGPRSHGDVTDVAIPFGRPTEGDATARILDGSGTPLAGVECVYYAASGKRTWGQTVMSDREGRVALPLARTPWAHPGDITLSVELPGIGWLVGSPGRTPVPGGRNYGDVVLKPAPIIASGRLVEHCPRPPGFDLAVQWKQNDQWDSGAPFFVTIANDGAFHVASIGADTGEPLRLIARTYTCLPIEPMPFERGRNDLVVELNAGLALRAQVLLPAEGWRMHDDGDLDFELERDDGSFELNEEFADGSLCITAAGLEAGTYSLTVACAGMTLLSLRDLRIAPGQPLDPRLDPLDLRDVLQVMRIRAMSTTGAPLDADGEVQFRTADTDGWVGWVYLRHGVAECPVPRRPVDVLVHADGYTPDLRLAASGSFEVALRPLREMRVVFDGMPPGVSELPWIAELHLAEPWATRFVALDSDCLAEAWDWADDCRSAKLRVADMPGLELVFLWKGAADHMYEAHGVVRSGEAEMRVALPADLVAYLRSVKAKD